MITYLKVRTNNKPYFLEVLRQDAQHVAGWRVGPDGIRNTPTLVIAHPSEVICEMVMNLHYGELEPR